MATDPRNAFQLLIRAWEEFHAAVLDTEEAEAPRMLKASERLADAYTVYDDVIFTNYGIEAPFDTYDVDDEYLEDEDADDDFDDDLDDDDLDDEFDPDDDLDDYDEDYDDYALDGDED